MGSISGSGRSLGRGNGNPLQHSYLVNPMDSGAWQATVHGVTKDSDTTQQLNNSNNKCIHFQINRSLKKFMTSPLPHSKFPPSSRIPRRVSGAPDENMRVFSYSLLSFILKIQSVNTSYILISFLTHPFFPLVLVDLAMSTGSTPGHLYWQTFLVAQC